MRKKNKPPTYFLHNQYFTISKCTIPDPRTQKTESCLFWVIGSSGSPVIFTGRTADNCDFLYSSRESEQLASLRLYELAEVLFDAERQCMTSLSLQQDPEFVYS